MMTQEWSCWNELEKLIEKIVDDVDNVSLENVAEATERKVRASSFIREPPSKEAHLETIELANKLRGIDIDNPGEDGPPAAIQKRAQEATIKICERDALYRLRKQQVK